MKKILVLLLLLVLTGCDEAQDNVEEDNKIDICFYSTVSGDFCMDKDLYEDTFIVADINNIYGNPPLYVEQSIDEYLDRHRGRNIRQLNGVYFKEESYIELDHIIATLNTNHRLQNGTVEVTQIDYSIRIIKRNGISYNDPKEFSVKMGTKYCTLNDEIDSMYGIIAEPLQVSAKHDFLNRLSEITQYSDITDFSFLDIDIDCYEDTIIIDDIEYKYSFKGSDFSVVHKEQDGNWSLPAFTSYNDDGRNYCMQSSITPETNFVLIEGELYGIQTALDNELIEGHDLWRYNITKCNWFSNIVIQIPYIEEPPFIEYDPISRYVNGYLVYRKTEIEAEGFYEMKYEDYYYRTTLENISELFIKEEDEFISLLSALESDLIDYEDIIESKAVNFLIYGYYSEKEEE